MRLFVPTTLPRRLAADKRWSLATWSPEARRFLHAWSEGVHAWDRPSGVKIRAIRDYPASYRLSVSSIEDPLLRAGLVSFARSLHRLRPSNKLVILSNMLDRVIDRDALHSLFAAVCAAFARFTRNPNACLYPPVPPVLEDVGFPLHADLWRAAMLLHVYDDVGATPGGESTFVSATQFEEALSTCSSLPRSRRREALSYLHGPHRDFNYQRLFELLHDSSNAWQAELGERLTGYQFEVRLRRGEGYLISDRHWLHGRLPAQGAVTRWRLHRLVFTTNERPSNRR